MLECTDEKGDDSWILSVLDETSQPEGTTERPDERQGCVERPFAASQSASGQARR